MSGDGLNERRGRIQAALQEIGAHDDIKPGAVLTGWALVMEWMDSDGERWLSRVHAPSKTPWEVRGMWHEALYADWPPVDDD